MLIPRKHKHSRRHIREEATRHQAKVMRLAVMYGMAEPWRTIWVTKAHHKYPRWEWQNKEKQGYSIQERRLDLQDQEED